MYKSKSNFVRRWPDVSNTSMHGPDRGIRAAATPVGRCSGAFFSSFSYSESSTNRRASQRPAVAKKLRNKVLVSAMLSGIHPRPKTTPKINPVLIDKPLS